MEYQKILSLKQKIGLKKMINLEENTMLAVKSNLKLLC